MRPAKGTISRLDDSDWFLGLREVRGEHRAAHP